MAISMDNLRDFCARTSLHGWVFCFRPEKPKFHTIGWLCIIAICNCAMIILMSNSISEFTKATVSFNLESPTVPLDEVFFPSLVLCNANSLRKSFILTLLKDPLLKNSTYYDLHQVVEKVFIHGSEDKPTNEEQDLLDRVFQSQTFINMTEDLIAMHQREDAHFANIPVIKWHAIWEADTSEENRETLRRSLVTQLASQWRDGEMVTHAHYRGWGIFYEPGFNTDISETCAWITVYIREPSDPQDLNTIKRSVANGANNGLKLLLDAESFDYSSSLRATEGFSISILHHLDVPIMKQTGIDIETGQAVKIAVTPELLNTTAASKRRFFPKERQCYFEEEISLKHFPPSYSYRYEMSNCLFEATLQKIESECDCTPVAYMDIVQHGKACQGVAKKCMTDLTDAMGSIRTIDDGGIQKECLAACVDQKHTFLLSQSTFPNIMSFYRRPEFCIVLDKLKISCSGDRRESLDMAQPHLCPILDHLIEQGINCSHIQANNTNMTKDLEEKMRKEVALYARDNMVEVTIYIRDPYVRKYVTEEKITEISFVGTIGGLMGLFIGFSFVSFVEILYYCCINSFCCHKWSNSSNDSYHSTKRRKRAVTSVKPIQTIDEHISDLKSKEKYNRWYFN